MKKQNIRILKVFLILSLLFIVCSNGVIVNGGGDGNAREWNYRDYYHFQRLVNDYHSAVEEYGGDVDESKRFQNEILGFLGISYDPDTFEATMGEYLEGLRSGYEETRAYNFILSRHTWAYWITDVLLPGMECWGSAGSDFCAQAGQFSEGLESAISQGCYHNYDRAGDLNTASSGFGGSGYAHIEGENINYYWMNESNTSQWTNATIYKISFAVENIGLLEDRDDILEFRVWGYGTNGPHIINLFSEIEPPDDEELWNYVPLNNGETYFRRGESMILIPEELLDTGENLTHVCLEFENHQDLSDNFRGNLEEGKNNDNMDSICNEIVKYDESQYDPDLPWLQRGDPDDGSEPESGYGGDLPR